MQGQAAAAGCSGWRWMVCVGLIWAGPWRAGTCRCLLASCVGLANFTTLPSSSPLQIPRRQTSLPPSICCSLRAATSAGCVLTCRAWALSAWSRELAALPACSPGGRPAKWLKLTVHPRMLALPFPCFLLPVPPCSPSPCIAAHLPSLCCRPGGMVRLAHAVVKNFLLAFKVRGRAGESVVTGCVVLDVQL